MIEEKYINNNVLDVFLSGGFIVVILSLIKLQAQFAAVQKNRAFNQYTKCA